MQHFRVKMVCTFTQTHQEVVVLDVHCKRAKEMRCVYVCVCACLSRYVANNVRAPPSTTITTLWGIPFKSVKHFSLHSTYTSFPPVVRKYRFYQFFAYVKFMNKFLMMLCFFYSVPAFFFSGSSGCFILPPEQHTHTPISIYKNANE